MYERDVLNADGATDGEDLDVAQARKMGPHVAFSLDEAEREAIRSGGEHMYSSSYLDPVPQDSSAINADDISKAEAHAQARIAASARSR